MAEKEKSDPLLFAAVAVLYPVLTHRQLRTYQDREYGYDDLHNYADDPVASPYKKVRRERGFDIDQLRKYEGSNG